MSRKPPATAESAPNPARRRLSSQAGTVISPNNPGYSPREILLAAAARAVLAAFREPLEQKRLSAPATATLRVLEAALELYGGEALAPPEPPAA
jgi:hypothetical protein